MADALWMRVREVEWDQYPTSDGTKVPNLLRNLASRKPVRAMKASQQAWTAFCGEGKVHPAAIQSVTFLIEIMNISDAGVQEGILDILLRLSSEGGEARKAVFAQKPKLQHLMKSRDEGVAVKAKQLILQLES